jgi:hypothetical protein
MNDDDMNNSILGSPLAALRAEMAGHDTPRGVEKELMQAFAQAFPPRRRWYHKLATPRWSIAGSVASAALVVLVFALSPRSGHEAGPNAARLASRDSAGVFIALDSLERIEQDPAPRMVETQVPLTALASLGVPVTPENAGDSVKAEMLVGANGEPLALRLTSLN